LKPVARAKSLEFEFSGRVGEGPGGAGFPQWVKKRNDRRKKRRQGKSNKTPPPPPPPGAGWF